MENVRKIEGPSDIESKIKYSGSLCNTIPVIRINKNQLFI